VSLRLSGLTLTKIFDGAEHVLCNGFLIFDDLLNDHRLGEGLLNSLRHDRLSSSIQQLLLTVTERMCLNVTRSFSNTRVSLPVVVTSSLLARAKVTVRLLVHFGGFTFFFHRATLRVEDVLGRHANAGGNTEFVGSILLGNLLRPLVTSLVADAERLSNG